MHQKHSSLWITSNTVIVSRDLCFLDPISFQTNFSFHFPSTRSWFAVKEKTTFQPNWAERGSFVRWLETRWWRAGGFLIPNNVLIIIHCISLCAKLVVIVAQSCMISGSQAWGQGLGPGLRARGVRGKVAGGQGLGSRPHRLAGWTCWCAVNSGEWNDAAYASQRCCPVASRARCPVCANWTPGASLH